VGGEFLFEFFPISHTRGFKPASSSFRDKSRQKQDFPGAHSLVQ
jgi:hypothetical protein